MAELTQDDLSRLGLARDPASPDGRPLAAGSSIERWTEALARCTDPADLAGVIHHVNCSDDSALARLHQFLEQAAERARRLPGAAYVATAIDVQARALYEIGDALDQISIDLVDAARHAPPADLNRAHLGAARTTSLGRDQPGPRTPSSDPTHQTAAPPTHRRRPR